MINALDNIDLDSGDIAAMPENFEQPILDAIRRQLDLGDIHNWLDLYLTGADKLRSFDPSMPTKLVHETVVPLVSQVIEEAI